MTATDLRARLAEAIDRINHDDDHPDWNRAHGDHGYDGGCPICRGDSQLIAAALLPFVESLLTEQRAAIVAAIRHEARTRYRGVPNPAMSTDTAVRLAQQAIPATQTSPQSSGATTPTARPGPTTKRTRAGAATDAPERN
jgi:hypothetical protein